MSNWVMKLLLALCAGCYAGAFVCLLERFEKKLRPAWKWVFTGSALALNTGLVVYNYIINPITNGASYAPFVSVVNVSGVDIPCADLHAGLAVCRKGLPV